MSKVSTFIRIKELINTKTKLFRDELFNGKPWGRNIETFYILNLYKLGYIEGEALNCSGNKVFTVVKKIPDGYNSSSLRKEMKEKKNLIKI